MRNALSEERAYSANTPAFSKNIVDVNVETKSSFDYVLQCTCIHV